MIRLPPRSTRTDTLFPCTTLFRSLLAQHLGTALGGCGFDVELRNPQAEIRSRNFRLDLRPSEAGGRQRDTRRPLAAQLQRQRYANRRLGASQTLRSEEHTSELQSLMRITYAVFCLKKKHTTTT